MPIAERRDFLSCFVRGARRGDPDAALAFGESLAEVRLEQTDELVLAAIEMTQALAPFDAQASQFRARHLDHAARDEIDQHLRHAVGVEVFVRAPIDAAWQHGYQFAQAMALARDAERREAAAEVFAGKACRVHAAFLGSK